MLAVCGIAVADAPKPEQSVLRLRQGTVRIDARTDLPATAARLRGGSRWCVLHLDGPIDRRRYTMLERAGVVLEGYLPDHAYIVRLDRLDPAAFARIGFARSITPFEADWKLDPELGRREFKTPARRQIAQAGAVQVVVTLFNGETPDQAVRRITESGGTVLAETHVGDHWLLDATMPLANAKRLAELESVQYIEDAPEGTLRNDTNEWILQSNVAGETPVWDAGIHGEGQIGGLIDGTIYQYHCTFDDPTAQIGPDHRKIVALRNASPYPDAHGTHVAGTMAADKEPYGEPDQYDGIAYAAKISFSNVSPVYAYPSTLYARLEDAHEDGARVHSNSWGDDFTTSYTTWSRQIDQFSYDYEESLVAFAVTNQDYLKTPENAKNVLAVGATYDTPSQHVHYSGGAGPTADGRRKPEIYAPGYQTESSYVNACGTVPISGTSMACPAVSGAGLLVRQYFTDGYHPTGLPVNYPLTPSGALIKAVLLNSTVDLAGVPGYPSNKEGWGRLLLNSEEPGEPDNGLYFPGDAARLFVADVRNAGGLSTGEQTSFVLGVQSNAVPLQITLVFTEPPAFVGAVDPVINNLDLEVTGPDGTVYKGNWFDAGESARGGTADSRNNVERVILSSPAPGDYVVAVKGTAVNEGTQGYALAITADAILDEWCLCPGPTALRTNARAGSPEGLDAYNGNGLPGTCEPDEDCNGNGVRDMCDVVVGTSSDCNRNAVPDECDAVPPGDFDIDDDVDLDDGLALVQCLGGPGLLPNGPAECAVACLSAFDFNDDLDVDLSDAARFQAAFTGQQP